MYHIETNDKRWEVGPVEAKSLMQTREKFCEVFALKFASFVHKIVRCYLSVVQALLSFAAPPNFFCDLLYASVNR